MVQSRLNHVSVLANDLEESAQFYEEVLDMTRVPTPNFDVEVMWLEIGEGGGQLHLFDRPVEAPQYHHFGVTVADFEAVYHEAVERDIVTDFSDDDSPRMYALPDGAVQLYITDPAGNLVEVNWPDVEVLDESIRENITYRSDLRPQTGEAAEATLGLGSAASD